MQSVSPDITPEAVQSYLCCRRLCPRHFKDTRRYPQTSVGGHDFDTCNPLGKLTALFGCELVPLGGVFTVDRVHYQANLVGQGFCSAKMGKEVAVRGQDVKFVRCFVLVLMRLSARITSLRSSLLTSPPNGQALVLDAVYLVAKSSAPSAIPR